MEILKRALVVLILAILSTAVTGWLLTTDSFWGVRWMQHVHNVLAHGLIVLVAFHIAGVVLACYRHRENLVAAMISGQKRPSGANDIS